MKPEIACTLRYGLFAGIIFLLPAMYHVPLMDFIGIESVQAFFISQAGIITFFVIIHAYFTSVRYEGLENKLEKRYRLIFEKLPNCVWVIADDSYRILTANELALENYGSYSKPFGDKLFTTLFQEPEKVELELIRQPYTIRNLVMIDKNYDPRQVDLFSMPFLYDGKDCVMVLAVDHSEIHYSLQENMLLNDSLKEQNKRLREFSFVHSHHIRSHLANILGIINLTGDQDTVSREELNMLRTSAKKLDQEIKKVNQILMEDSDLNPNETRSGQSSKVIVFVDDDKVQHMINKRILLKINPKLELVFFENPYDALSWLEKNMADILLLDINMPEMEGWDFLKLMEERGIKMEVKMLTSSLDPKDIEKSYGFGMVSGFLVKPLRKEVIDEFL
jgi:CheY-like chemotaxis protein